MSAHLDLNAAELATWAAQARYVALAAQSLSSGPPADPVERENCLLYLLEVIEDISSRAEVAAESLRDALETAARAPLDRGGPPR